MGFGYKGGFILTVFTTLFLSLSMHGQSRFNLDWEESVGAETFPSEKTIYWVNDFGKIRRSDMILVTENIQNAINKCAEEGGGIVAFKPGTYLTGALFLKDNVNLRIDKEVTLLAIQDIEYFPEIETRIAGVEMAWPSAVINVIGKKNVAVTGDGLIDAQGRVYWEKYWNMRTSYEEKKLRWIVDYDCKRVRTLLVAESKDITISDLTFQQAGFWTVHLLYSENVTVSGITIRNNIKGMGPSTDGVDIDSSSKILIEKCDIDCHDDNFCLKSGRDADGLRVNRPTEYVVIRDCISRVGAGLVTIGSETSGSIRNILAYNNKAIGTDAGIKMKSALTRGGVIENIYLCDLEFEGVNYAISVGLNWNPSYSYSTLPEEYNINEVPKHWRTMLQHVEPKEKGIPKFKNVFIENITGENCKLGITANGIENSTLENFTLKNISISCEKAGAISYCEDWKLENVVISTVDHQKVDVKKSQKVIGQIESK